MDFRSVDNLDEALNVLSELGSDAQILAGGTDVMVQMMNGDLDPQTLLHIEAIGALRSIERRNGRVEIGALVTHRKASGNEGLQTWAPALCAASKTVGGWQTQEVGTIVGNLANASPAADTIPTLLTADCNVTLQSTSGERRLPIGEFIKGRRSIDRNPDELITMLDIEPVGERTGDVYIKVGPRSAMEVALVGLAVRLQLADDGETAEDVRIAACAVGPIPYRATAAEAVLVGSRLDDEALSEAGRQLEQSASPIDDARAGASYRRRVLAPLLARAVGQARDKAREEQAWN